MRLVQSQALSAIPMETEALKHERINFDPGAT